MHYTAKENGKSFFNTYVKDFGVSTVVEIGSINMGGNFREYTPDTSKYIGVDLEAGEGVDIILDDPYILPFEDNSIDFIVSSSVFEHIDMFWVTFLESVRVLKPSGLFYFCAPSNGFFHRFPVDSWRFYPDSGNSLVKWANRNGHNSILLESFTTKQYFSIWNDYVAVILKDANLLDLHPNRIIPTLDRNFFTNGLISGVKGFLNYFEAPEDRLKLMR